MTDLVTPGGIDTEVDNLTTGHALDKSGLSGRFVVDGAELSPFWSQLNEAAMDAFDITHSSNSLTVTVHPGEAYVGGWLARDVNTPVSLPANQQSQIFLGWDPDHIDEDRVVIGTDSAFRGNEPRMLIFTVNTGGSGVSSVTDNRQLEPPFLVDETGDLTAGRTLDMDGNRITNTVDFEAARVTATNGSQQYGHLTITRTGNNGNSYETNLGNGGFGVRNTDGTALFHFDSNGRLNIGSNSANHPALLTVPGTGRISGVLRTDSQIDARGGLEAEEIDLTGTGNSGVMMSDGTRFSTFQGYATLYSYSGDDGNGWRFRDPDGVNNALQVTSNGNATFAGSVTANGNRAVTSPQGGDIYVQTSQPSGMKNGDIWVIPE